MRHSHYAEYFLGEGDLPSMSIRSTLIVATAIATLGLGSYPMTPEV
jgi:hypothetical protein